jgi:4-oxalocrotonate tautomerase
MPLITFQTLENVLTPEQKKQIIAKITDAVIAIEGESVRDVTWVKIEEVREGCWGVGGHALYARDVLRMQNARARIESASLTRN